MLSPPNACQSKELTEEEVHTSDRNVDTFTYLPEAAEGPPDWALQCSG